MKHAPEDLFGGQELIPLDQLAAALMICGFGAVLHKRLSDPTQRNALLANASAQVPQAMAALSTRGLGVARGAVVGPALVVVRSETPWDRAPDPKSVIAVVGARAVDPYGLTIARTLGESLARSGFTVASGGAEGCDAAAHEGAMSWRAPKGPATIAVTPGGLDHPYPAIHDDLFRRVIRSGGALVSADWPTASLKRHAFIDRNHVIAALSGGVIVVRARVKSGSLSTARAAQRLGRPVGAVPGNVGSLLSEGCHVLLEGGAAPIASAASLVRFQGRVTSDGLPTRRERPWPQHATPQPAPWRSVCEPGYDADGPGSSAHDTPQHIEIMKAIREEPGIDLDSLADRTNLAAPTLAGALIELEVSGRVARGPGGRYMATD